ncbi:MAG: molybdopterin-dependent oxidoreductase, partial [Planctomycetota bacterium]
MKRCAVLMASVVLTAAWLTGLRAADEVLVIEQEYNIIEQGKEGVKAKDYRQKLYIGKDVICIDDYGGKDGKLKPATWDNAIAAIRKAAKAAKKTEKALLVAPRVTNETAQTITKFTGKLDRVGMCVAANESALCREPSFSADAMRKLEDADAIIIIGAQPSRDHGVVAARIRTAVRKREAKLLIFHARKSDLDQYANICAHEVSLEHQFWDEVAAALEGVQRPAIVYGANAMTPIGVTVLERFIKIFEGHPGRQAPALIGLPVGTNSLALAAAGIEAIEDVGPWLDAKPLKFLHIVASDAPDGGAGMLEEKYVPG